MGRHARDEKTAADDAQPQRGGVDPGLESGAGSAIVVDRSGNLKQGQVERAGQSVKIADAEHAKPDRLLAPNVAQLPEVLPQQRHPVRLVGMRRGRLDLVTGDQGEQGEETQNGHRRVGGMPGIVQKGAAKIEKCSAGQAAQKHAGNRRHLHHADCGADFCGGDDFLDDALLGRGKNRALHPQEKQPEDRQTQIMISQGAQDHRHDGELSPQGRDDDIALGEAVRNPARRGRKKDERQEDDGGQDRLDHLGVGVGAAGKQFRCNCRAQGHEHKLGGIIIQQDLNLHRNE